MVLDPKPVWRAWALDQTMGVLHVRVAAHIWGQEGGEHAVGAASPGRACVVRLPHAAARDADPHDPAVARIDADGMDRRPLRAAAHPLLALGIVPQGANQLPVQAVVARAEEPARNGPTPQKSLLVRAASPARIC